MVKIVYIASKMDSESKAKFTFILAKFELCALASLKKKKKILYCI